MTTPNERQQIGQVLRQQGQHYGINLPSSGGCYADAGQLAQIAAQYPSMFPGGAPVPLFTYSCNTPSGSQPCSSAGANNAPRYISDVDIVLIVETLQPDLQTQSLKLIELTGRGHRTNSAN